MTEYPTLTELMKGREPGSVKVRRKSWPESFWVRVGRLDSHGLHECLDHDGFNRSVADSDGPWLIVSEDAPALDMLRLEIAARVLAELPTDDSYLIKIKGRYAYALEEADALLAEARRTPSAEAQK